MVIWLTPYLATLHNIIACPIPWGHETFIIIRFSGLILPWIGFSIRKICPCRSPKWADWIGLSNAPYCHIFPKHLGVLPSRIYPTCKIDYFVVNLPFAVVIHYPCPNFSFHFIWGINLISELLTHTEDCYPHMKSIIYRIYTIQQFFFFSHQVYTSTKTLFAHKCSDNFLLKLDLARLKV